MKIKKISEEVTYIQKSINHHLEINGKKVRIWDYQKQDMLFEDYDSDTDINEDDREKLTEEEADALDDYMNEALDLKEGEILTIND